MESFQYCDLDRNIDEIIEIYRKINQQIIDLLAIDPRALSQSLWQNNNLIDRECRCQRLSSNIYLNLASYSSDYSSPYKCVPCIVFDRLLSHNIDETSYPLIKIEYGKYANKYIKVEEFQSVQPRIVVKGNAILVDKFTNIFLTNLYLQRMIDGGVKQLLAGFICGSNGYLLYEACDLNSLDEFANRYLTSNHQSNIQIVERLLNQLFTLLMKLKETQLSIFNINPSTFNFISMPDNFKLILNLNDISAFSVNNYRVYTENRIAAIFKTPFEMRKINYNYLTCDETCRQLSRCIYYFDDQQTNFQISGLNLSAYRNLHSDLSFEAYLFMITLMKQPLIYQTILNDNYLSNLWNELWIGDEQPLILNEINYLDKIPDIEPILMTYKLRCDIVDYVWNKVKNE